MSTLTVDNVEPLSGSVTAPSVQISAWNHVNALTGTPVIQNSLNITSVTDNGVGRVQHNFTSNMANVTYTLGGGGQFDETAVNGGSPYIGVQRRVNMFLTTSGESNLLFSGTNVFDGIKHMVTVVGDLA